MVRVYIPGLTGLSLRVTVTTNGQSWTAGVVDTLSRAVATDHGVIPASKIKRVRYIGIGTRFSADEVRAAVILLAAIGGMEGRELMELAQDSIGLVDPFPAIAKHLPGKPRIREQKEIPSGLHPVSLDREERRRIGLLESGEFYSDEEEALAV